MREGDKPVIVCKYCGMRTMMPLVRVMHPNYPKQKLFKYQCTTCGSQTPDAFSEKEAEYLAIHGKKVGG